MEIHITSILDIFCSNLWTTFVGGYHANDCMKRATMISGSFVVNWCKSYQIWVWLKTLAPGWFFWLVDGCWFSHVIGFDPSPSGTFSCWETMSNGLRCTWGQLPAVFFSPECNPSAAEQQINESKINQNQDRNDLNAKTNQNQYFEMFRCSLCRETLCIQIQYKSNGGWPV